MQNDTSYVSSPPLSPMATEAVEDFERLLRIMGKESMNANEFCAFMSSLGYEGDPATIFHQLVALVGQDYLDTNTLRRLYASPTYTACESHQETARNVIDHIKSYFLRADRTGNGMLEREEVEDFVIGFLGFESNGGIKEADNPVLHDVLKVNEMIDEIFSRVGGSDRVNLEQLTSIVLRYSSAAETSELKLHGFDEKTLNPFHSTPDEFVESMEQFVFQHPALNHHLLDSFEKGAYGHKTVDIVTHFLEAYRFFTLDFCTYLTGCINKVSKEEHVQLLTENQEEENGHYKDDDIEMMVELGLDPELLKGVIHKDLFVQQVGKLKRISGSTSYDTETLRSIASSMVTAFNAACIGANTSSAESSTAAIYFGSELIASNLYGKLSGFLQKDDRLTTQDLAFFILHIDMDVEHTRLMRKVVVDIAHTKVQRERMVTAVARIMDARVDFYDKFVQCIFPPTGHGATASGALYNKQSTNWVRKTANCLSDFTGRPVIFDMCSPHIRGAQVLDVGCGEGYAARRLMMMGADAVTGIDISSEMVARARENALMANETYLVGDAAQLKAVVEANLATLGIVPGAATEIGCFDLAVGIFVFNYTSIFDMNRICQQVHQMLKPGGHFVFSVPHPFMLNAHANQEDTFGFNKGDVNVSSYFSLRDRKFAGTIKTLDGRVLNVKMCFKAISDYVEAVTGAGFEISYIHEARVLPEHVKAHPEFFESVKDSPLHIIFKVQKPEAHEKPSTLQEMPKKIRWGPYHFQHPESTFIIGLPLETKNALNHVVQGLLAKGVTADTYDMSSIDKNDLDSLAKFAVLIRQRLVCDTGVAMVRGLEVGPASEEAAKLSFYLLASLVGTVDGSARGRLFDVKDRQLCTSNDNVLFSASNTEATWHTDGASVNRSYDVASLLCIQPSTRGGELRVSNAVNAFESLETNIPKFLLYELQRSIPRDVMENGGGQGRKEDALFVLSRSAELLKLRIRNNAYPIVASTRDSMRFRYMRHWIETGHVKAGLTQSPLLTVAMDLLDSALDKNQLWEGRMQTGDVIFCNNLLVAHSRRSFSDEPGEAPRHKVRAWLKF
jgi:SAM-dependent methyltransferase/pyrroloquinoline quinone (PQQ) biosynthesis protein C